MGFSRSCLSALILPRKSGHRSKEKEDEFVDYLFDRKIPVMTLGHVTKGEIRIDDQSMGFVDKGLVSETIDDLDE